MYCSFKIFINIQEVDGNCYVATLDKTDVLKGISEEFEVISGTSVAEVVRDKLSLYEFSDSRVIFILDEKEVANQHVDFWLTMDNFYSKAEFLTDWSLIGYRVIGDTTNIKDGEKVDFIEGKNEELGLDIRYPFGNGDYTLVNGGPEVGYLALAKIAHELEDGSFGTTTVAECLFKGYKPCPVYSLQVELARLTFRNYLKARDDRNNLFNVAVM